MSFSSRHRLRSPERRNSRRVIIEGLTKKDVTDGFLRHWLGRYGTIEDIRRFQSGIVVKFKFPNHAYDAVKNENRWRGPYESRLKLADSKALATLGCEIDGNQDSKSSTVTDSSSTSSYVGSKALPMGGTDAEKPEWTKPSSSPSSTPHSTSSFELVKCDVYLLPLGADMTHYSDSVGEMLQQKAAQMASTTQFRPPSMKTMVLTHEDHLGPCFMELSLAGVLYCLVFTPENYSRQTCTLRILQGSKHVEHRNMSTSAAVEMLLSHFARHASQQTGRPDTTVPDRITPPLTGKPTESLEVAPKQPDRRSPSRPARKRHRKESASSLSSSSVSGSDSSLEPRPHRRRLRSRRRRGSSPPPPPHDDPAFEAPSQRMVSYLHMLADSRVLSVAELDQVLAFVKRRRDLMAGEAPVDALKSRIAALVNLDLEPKTTAISTVTSSMPVVNSPGFFATNMSVTSVTSSGCTISRPRVLKPIIPNLLPNRGNAGRVDPPQASLYPPSTRKLL